MKNQVDYTADGVRTVFQFPFAIETAADCQVLVDGAPGVEYSVFGQASIDGGAVVFKAPQPDGAIVILRRRGEIAATADDADTGYLADKLVKGNNIALSTVTAADGSQQVCIDADDLTVEDLSSLLEEGSNITLSTPTDGDGVQHVRIDAAQPDMSSVLYRNVSAVVEAGFWTKPVVLTEVNGIAMPDPLAGTVFTLNLTAAVTLGFPSGMSGKAGMFLVVAKQDAVGGHALTLAPGYATVSGELSIARNAVNLLWVTSDGSGTVLDVVIAQRQEG